MALVAVVTRPTYVYRLAVEYPEGVDWRNPPKGWEPYDRGPNPEDGQALFMWPTRRHYMSRAGAKNRADLLTDWGCKVTIERSNPVTWPER